MNNAAFLEHLRLANRRHGLDIITDAHNRLEAADKRIAELESRPAAPVVAEGLTIYEFSAFEDGNRQQYVLLDEVTAILAAHPVAGSPADAYPTFCHPDDSAVDRFTGAMKAKMAASRAKGRGGWDDPAQCSVELLAAMLVDHIPKADPVDIANFCMMLHQRGADPSVLVSAWKAAVFKRRSAVNYENGNEAYDIKNLDAAPVPASEPPTLIGAEVSMDVSTGETDAEHRIFGRVAEVMRGAGGEVVILAEEVSRNFAAPVPDSEAAIGYISSEAQEQLRVGGSILTAITRHAITGNHVPLYLAAPAAPTDARPDGWPNCPHCGTHEIEMTRTCHNSACSSYARAETTYEGWKKTPTAAQSVRDAAQRTIAAEDVRDTERLDFLFSMLPMGYFCIALGIDQPENTAPISQGKWARSAIDAAIASATTTPKD